MKQTTFFPLPQPGIYPFWFWNGAMEEPELSRQLRLFQQSGCRGAAIHCRTGNRIEYLSDRWLELCRFTAEESRRIGFKLWLYDEAGYPSGNADGNVQKGHPELEQIFLQFEYAGADPDHPAAWAFLPGTRTGVSERDLPPGTPLLRFHLRRNPRHVDVFHPESCRRFLRFTHERYETVLKEFFGEVIEAVYTDDESYLMSGFYGLAWSPVLNEEFRKRYGEELSAFLPLLVEDLPGAEELRIRYRKTAEELFLKNFILPQREFCRRNGLFYTGHLSCDEGPFQNSIGHFSSPFRYLKMLDIPAIDDYLCDRNDQDYLGGRITEKKDRYMKFTDIRVHPLMIYKSAASVARQFHDGLLSCECLTFLGWDRKPEFWDLQMRFEIGMGVNMFTPHAFYYTLGGPAKEDCPPSYFLQQPGYEQFRPLFESWVHGAEILRRGTFHADVLLIFPERIYSAVHGSDLLNSFREREKRRTPELVTVEEEFSRTEFDLMRRHVGFDCAPEGVLIRDAQLEGRKLRLGACTYSTLLIPETVPLAPETASLLDTFRENGVRILRTGERALLKPDLDIQGRLSGEVDLFNFFSGMGANMEISGKGLKLKGEELGEISILSRRDLARNRFNLLINNYILGENPINISGYFIPGRNYLDADLRLENFSLTTISPFLADIMDISGGYISGDIGATGQLDMLMLSSENSHIDSMAVTPVFTQVPYIVSGPITMSRQRIELDSLSITDPDGATAMLAGSITHDFFKNIYLDANLNFNEFQVLNTQEIHNEKFYGTAYASGQVGLSGFTDNLQIDAQVTTAGNSSLHIPLSSSSSASTTDLISYTDFRLPADSTVLPADIEGTEHIRHRGNIEIRATAGVTSGTELQIEIDKQLGDILRCNGNGNINLTLNPSRNIMDLRGDYTINEGSLHYTLYMQSRDFTINEGGTIAFNGDLKNTNLNVGATYSTKASISTLIADTTSVGNRRNVNCGIQIQGSLTNPELSFSIDIPDLDPITKGRVESALSTPDKVQKQFMALLISGSFVPDEQSGIINNSTILYSNASEMLSNQFNNIFRQLDIPLDLGLNYQPGGSNGSWGMFDVAVSYQAFNNRLIINGNVGNDETSSNWAGDFDAEIKVDRQGKLRVTLFTRSADSYSNYLDNTQRSGFGVTYQDEFDTFGDFWRNIFFTRKRREQYELQQLRKAEEELEKEAAEANIVKEEILRPRENPMNFLEETGSVEYQEQEQENQIYYYKEEEEEETVRAE